MGFMDKFLHKEKPDSEPTPEKLDQQFEELHKKLEKSLPDQSVKVDYILDTDARNIQREQSEKTQEIIDSVVGEETRKTQIEMFYKIHATVENFRKAFLAAQIRKKMGIIDSESQSPYMKKLDVLKKSGLISDRSLSKIFLPYLVEKKALGILSNDEQQELNAMLGTTGKKEDIENATTHKSYSSDFNKALTILGAIGVIKLEEFAPCKEFPKGREIRDPVSKDNLTLYIESRNLASKIYSQQINSTDSKGNFTSADVATNALLQTAKAKTIESHNIEQVATKEKGETEYGK